MPESTQHKLDRIRPPRVQITYDVETRGSFIKMELPFVVGILADLSGNVPDPNPAPMRDRKYVEIDRDNFNDVMKKIGPKIASNGKNLAFETIDDFSPIKVLKKLPANEQYTKRTQLSDMAAKLDGNVRLQQNLLAALKDDTKRDDLKKTMTDLKNHAPKIETSATEAAKSETAKSETGKPEESTEGPKDEGGKS
ncbi:MAG TPA: type VI secretion system contractile sheath small subunit [Pyrinomonadaceae bacterium]|nr:type VI secretion system contractile sheath small subunit [Pyrinomonadaceae bacterium]